MATIASLSVDLKASTQKFEKGLKKARRELRRFAGSIPGANLLLSKFGAALSIGGFAIFTKNTMSSMDVVSKLSDRLNIATERLVGLQHAAAITGLEGDNLNKGMEVLARRIGEANQGLGEGKRVFQQLGLDSHALAAKDLGIAFEDVAESIKGLATQADKAAAANSLFGRAGTRLISLFDLGRDGIIKMRKEAERLGITFTRQQGAMVEAANDSMTRLRAVFKGGWQRLTIEMAPYIEAGANMFADWASSGVNAANQIKEAVQAVADVVMKTAAALAWSIAQVEKGGATAAGLFSGLRTASADVRKAIGSALVDLGGKGSTAETLGRQLQAMGGAEAGSAAADKREAYELYKEGARMAGKAADLWGMGGRMAAEFEKKAEAMQRVIEMRNQPAMGPEPYRSPFDVSRSPMGVQSVRYPRFNIEDFGFMKDDTGKEVLKVLRDIRDKPSVPRVQ